MTKNVRETDNSQMANHLMFHGADKNVVAFEDEVKKWFHVNAKRLRGLCGTEEDARRLLLAALNSISKVPSLMECSFTSFTRCLLTSAEYRLFPGAMQECAYLPFKNNGVSEATFVMMYPGLCQLLYRSGMIKDIEAEVVCSRDLFDYTRGSNRKLVFEPYDADLEDRGEWIGVYCIIRNIFGGEHIKWLTAKDVASIKARSPAARSSYSPWNSKYPMDVAWMWMKTALKQNKFVPKSAILAAALAEDTDSSDAGTEVSVAASRMTSAISAAPAAQPQQEAQQPKTIEHVQRTTIEIPVSKTPAETARPSMTDQATSETLKK